MDTQSKKPLNILLAIDGSEHSRAAVMLLRQLPISQGLRSSPHVTALGVLRPLDAYDHITHRIPLGQAQKLLEEKGFSVQTELLLGYPAEIIQNYAEEHEPDLIVVGAKGLRATLGILLGGVAQQIVEYACCPVLVVRAPHRDLQHLLLVTDGSVYSQRAANYLTQFPIPKDADMHVVHVLPPTSLLQHEIIAQTWIVDEDTIASIPVQSEEEYQIRNAEEEQRGRSLLDQTVEILQTAGITPTSALLRGDAATEIIEYIKENKIDLVIAGSRGLSQIRGWLLGSVSRKLVHYAGCSVLVVKERPQ